MRSSGSTGRSSPAVVWLDDVQQYADQALSDSLKQLLLLV